jgi:hypothetical protein
MKTFRAFALPFVVAVSTWLSPASAAPVLFSETNWSTLGPPDVEFFGNSFTSAGTYHDGYKFTLTSPASSFGGIIELSTLFNTIDVDVTSATLYANGTQVGLDTDPLFFSFANLSAGTSYLLVITSVVTNDPGLWRIPVGYTGLIATIADPPAPIETPLPATIWFFGTVIAGYAGLSRWRKRSQVAAIAV